MHEEVSMIQTQVISKHVSWVSLFFSFICTAVAVEEASCSLRPTSFIRCKENGVVSNDWKKRNRIRLWQNFHRNIHSRQWVFFSLLFATVQCTRLWKRRLRLCSNDTGVFQTTASTRLNWFELSYGDSGVMRSAGNGHVNMAKVSRRVPDTRVCRSRSFHAETKSKPACLHRHGAREKSGILKINTPIFLTPLQEQVEFNKLWGHQPFEILFSKKNHFYL